MSDTADAGVWTVVSATARGSRHDRSGAPNQDASAYEVLQHGGHDLVLMAVADGHGGARYVRSDVGSRLAVEIGCETARSAVMESSAQMSRRQLERVARESLAPAIVEQWRAACLAHLAANPFTEQERILTPESLDAEPFLAYGSTLLLAILGDSGSVVLQLGDGDCLVAGRDGRLQLPMVTDDRLFGGETTSLCLSTAVSDIRFASTNGDGWSFVLLATDGYGVAFADPNWRELVTRDLFRAFRERGEGYVASMLPGWLSDSASVGGDDATLVVAFRSTGGAVARRPSARANPRRRRTGALIAVLLAGLLAGGTGGWALGRPSSSPSPPPVDFVTPDDPAEPDPNEPDPNEPDPNEPDPDPGGATPDAPPALDDGAETPVEADVGGGDAIPGTAPNAWLLTAEGDVIAFTADPTRANPQRSTLERSPTTPAVQQVYAWGAVWSLQNEELHIDGEPLGLDTDPPLRLGSLGVENNYLWALSEEGDRLLAVELPSKESCWIVPVRSAAAPTIQTDLACRIGYDPTDG